MNICFFYQCKYIYQAVEACAFELEPDYNFDSISISFSFSFSFSHGLNQAARWTGEFCCKLGKSIFPPVCVIHFGLWLGFGWWYHFVTRLISSAQMRKIALNVRNAESRLKESGKWIKRRLVVPAMR